LASKQIDIHEKLVKESLDGSLKAQHQLYKLYAGAMYYTCYHMMHSREEAEDMLQEAFSEAFMTLHRFRAESTFGTWLKRIVVNKCINEIKRKKTDLTFSDDMGHFEERHADENESLVNLNVAMVKEAMNELPDGSRVIFQLYLLEGYDHREIAKILDVSESNSKSQYMRARLKVKEILKDRIYEN
jgi:RNA polymerase sigma-70 factor (ECF subfamily)